MDMRMIGDLKLDTLSLPCFLSGGYNQQKRNTVFQVCKSHESEFTNENSAGSKWTIQLQNWSPLCVQRLDPYKLIVASRFISPFFLAEKGARSLTQVPRFQGSSTPVPEPGFWGSA
jgi:hypothetical protein